MTQTLPNSGSEWMSLRDCATELGVSDTTIRTLVQKGQLIAADVSTGQKSNFRINRADWQRYLEAAVQRTSDRFGSS